MFPEIATRWRKYIKESVLGWAQELIRNRLIFRGKQPRIRKENTKKEA